MKSGKPQVQTTTVDPFTDRARQEIFNRARDVSNQQYTPYGGPRVAGIDPTSQNAIGTVAGVGSQLGLLGQMGMNAFENFQMSGQGLNNLGANLGMQGQDMNALGGRFDQMGQQMGQWGQGADQRASGYERFGDQFGSYMNTGNVGAKALGGDQAATQTMMNPYQQQVIDAVGADFDRQRQQAHTDSNQAATAAGAFGGSRHGVMEGARMGELDAAQLGTMANIRQTGFNDAMNRANQAANLGFGAGQMGLAGINAAQGERGLGLQGRQVGQQFNQLGMDARGLGAQYQGMGLDARGLGLQAQNLGLGALGQAQSAYQGQAGVGGQLFGMGDYNRQIGQQGLDTKYNDFLEQRDWNARNLGILQGGLTGLPYGQTQTTPTQRNVASGILGGAATGFGIGGPIGAGIGGLLGIFG